MAGRVVVLDNGGATCKLGFADGDRPASVFPNASAKVKGERAALVADQILGVEDLSTISLRRPTDRGYVVNWDLEKAVWERGFRAVLQAQPRSCGLVVTEPFFNLPALQAAMDQVVFEEFRFHSCLPAPGPALALRAFAARHPRLPAAAALAGLVVDCGFSFTHVAPVFDGRVLLEGVRRVNLGGKALTNYLKELVSFRSINMMEEAVLVEHIKEQACFVSQDLAADSASARAGTHSCRYVLPDGVSSGTGFLTAPLSREQQRAAAKEGKEVPAVSLGNERFMVPELLFRPSDIQLGQTGLAGAVAEAAAAVHPALRPLLFSNVLCCGGGAALPGFAPRLLAELRPLVPDHMEVAVHVAPSPALAAWHGGALLGRSPEYGQAAFTRAEYEERGSANLRQRARGGWTA